MDNLTLPADLEQFAADAVAAGRYRDVAEVVTAGVSLLRRLDAERAAFVQSLEAAEAEADRDGWVSLDDVETELRQAISEAARRSA